MSIYTISISISDLKYNTKTRYYEFITVASNKTDDKINVRVMFAMSDRCNKIKIPIMAFLNNNNEYETVQYHGRFVINDNVVMIRCVNDDLCILLYHLVKDGEYRNI